MHAKAYTELNKKEKALLFPTIFESLKKEIEEEVKREIRNSSFQIIEVEEDVDRYVLKYTMFVRELPGLEIQEHLGKIVVIEEDSFAYMFWFHYQNPSRFIPCRVGKIKSIFCCFQKKQQ